jgi:DNA-binding transcriptional regulator YdaS (Cro superfamily)
MSNLSVSETIQKFGGVCKMARVLGLRYPSIIQGWKERDKIPEWRMTLIYQKAEENNIDLNTSPEAGA